MTDDNGASLRDRATHEPSPDGLGHAVSVPSAGPHDWYGGCDGFGPLWTCSECTGIIARDDGTFFDSRAQSDIGPDEAAARVGDFLLVEAERAALEAMGCCAEPIDVADYVWRRLIFSFPGNPWRHEKVARSAQAIEARRAATTGAVHESAVRKDAP